MGTTLEAKEFDIAVIGITDYMTIDGYKKIYESIKDTANPRLSSVKFILPNIEFRAQPSTTDGRALNIHLLVNPADSDHIDKIQRALRNLKVFYNSTQYGCYKDDLIDFAKAQDPNIDNDQKAYKFGIEQFKSSLQICFLTSCTDDLSFKAPITNQALSSTVLTSFSPIQLLQ